jgi:hypothetical protein
MAIMQRIFSCLGIFFPGWLSTSPLRIFFLLTIVLPQANPASAQHKSISRPELEDLLAHSINVATLNDFCRTPDGLYPGTSVRIVHEGEMAAIHAPGSVDVVRNAERLSGRTFARYEALLRLIRDVRPRFITDAVSHWGAWDWEIHLNRCRMTVADIKAVDSSIVVQASPNEFVERDMVASIGIIPAWVWEAFGAADEGRRFDMDAMMFPDWRRHKTEGIPQRWWDEYGMKDGKPKAIVPDIRTREAQMWFYYQGRVFIDMGCESISFCQVELMNNGSHNPMHWNIVFEKLRTYADTKSGIRYLLITGGTNGMKDAQDNLAFDFHMSPIRTSELGTHIDANGGDCHLTAESCEWQEGDGKIYGRSLGGRTPSGWSCTSLPGLVLLDNFGNNGPPDGWGTPVGTSSCNQYHFDEITWFALQDETYRNAWLRYAHARVHRLDPVIYFSLPVKRDVVYHQSWYPAHYLAVNPVPGLFDPPATLGDEPLGDVDRHRAWLYCAYGQEDVIKELLAAHPKELYDKAGLRLSPNPVATRLTIALIEQGPARWTTYAITNAIGAIVRSGRFTGMKHGVDVSALMAGLYQVSVFDGEQRFAERLAILP